MCPRRPIAFARDVAATCPFSLTLCSYGELSVHVNFGAGNEMRNRKCLHVRTPIICVTIRVWVKCLNRRVARLIATIQVAGVLTTYQGPSRSSAEFIADCLRHGDENVERNSHAVTHVTFSTIPLPWQSIRTSYVLILHWGAKRQKHTTGGIPRWSPTLVLVARFNACVWQSGRDAQFSLTYGRMYWVQM